MSRPSNPAWLPAAGILTRLLARARAEHDYPNRCHSALAANPRWRCYRDLGHDGDHMHIDDRFHRIEWS